MMPLRWPSREEPVAHARFASCVRKAAFPSMAAAEAKAWPGQAPYRCGFCPRWHLTTLRDAAIPEQPQHTGDAIAAAQTSRMEDRCTDPETGRSATGRRHASEVAGGVAGQRFCQGGVPRALPATVTTESETPTRA